MSVPVVEISSLEDFNSAAASLGLPVGPRTGPGRRTKEKKEWYVALGFLKEAIPAGIFELPITIRNGCPPEEPDFVVMRRSTTDVIALIEITEATDEADQKEMTASELSRETTLLGEFGGRFSDGASRPGLVSASDSGDAIKRKDGKVTFRSSAAVRHLVVYPNSSASGLLFGEGDDGEATRDLREESAKDG